MARSLEIDPARTRGTAMLRELLRTMRPKEWIKNIFVFAAIAFARNTITGTPLWQEGYYEHVLREDGDPRQVARYILENPIRAGLVANPLDYPYIGSDRWTIRGLVDSV